WFSHFLRQNPNDATAAARLLSLLSSYNFPILLYPPLVHEGPVNAMDFGATGEHLATIASEKTARVWNVQTGRIESELTHPAKLTHCALAGDRDRRLLTLSAEPKARLWDLSTGQMIKEFGLGSLDERTAVRRILPSRDRRLVAFNVQSNAITVLD